MCYSHYGNFCVKDYDMKSSFETSEHKYCQQVIFVDN